MCHNVMQCMIHITQTCAVNTHVNIHTCIYKEMSYTCACVCSQTCLVEYSQVMTCSLLKIISQPVAMLAASSVFLQLSVCFYSSQCVSTAISVSTARVRFYRQQCVSTGSSVFLQLVVCFYSQPCVSTASSVSLQQLVCVCSRQCVSTASSVSLQPLVCLYIQQCVSTTSSVFLQPAVCFCSQQWQLV